MHCVTGLLVCRLSRQQINYARMIYFDNNFSIREAAQAHLRQHMKASKRCLASPRNPRKTLLKPLKSLPAFPDRSKALSLNTAIFQTKI